MIQVIAKLHQLKYAYWKKLMEIIQQLLNSCWLEIAVSNTDKKIILLGEKI